MCHKIYNSASTPALKPLQTLLHSSIILLENICSIYFVPTVIAAVSTAFALSSDDPRCGTMCCDKACVITMANLKKNYSEWVKLNTLLEQMARLEVKAVSQVRFNSWPLEKWQSSIWRGCKSQRSLLTLNCYYVIQCYFPHILYNGSVTGEHGHGHRSRNREKIQHGRWMWGKHWVMVVLQGLWTYNRYLRALKASDSTLQLEAIFLFC